MRWEYEDSYLGFNDGLLLKMTSREIVRNFSNLSTCIGCNEKTSRTSEFLIKKLNIDYLRKESLQIDNDCNEKLLSKQCEHFDRFVMYQYNKCKFYIVDHDNKSVFWENLDTDQEMQNLEEEDSDEIDREMNDMNFVGLLTKVFDTLTKTHDHISK